MGGCVVYAPAATRSSSPACRLFPERPPRADPDRAVTYLTDALAIQRALRADSAVAASLNFLGFGYATDFAEYDRALAYHRESLTIRTAVGDRWSLSLARRNIGLTYLAMGRPDAAHAEISAAMRVGEGTGNRGLATRNLLETVSDSRLETTRRTGAA